jgi:hypothetical protein
MAVWICCNSSLSEEMTKNLIEEFKGLHPNIMQYFWVSEPKPCSNFVQQDAARLGFDAKCSFVIDRNDDEGSRFLNVIPKLLYELFGQDTILVHGFDYELIRPEEAHRISATNRE